MIRWMLLLLLLASPALAYDRVKIKRDCKPDAVIYCAKSTSLYLLALGDQQKEQAVIDCMLSHRDKLRNKCVKHFKNDQSNPGGLHSP